MKLYYITSSRIPTDKAYGYAISKMCEQFGKQGVEVTLVLANYTPLDEEDIFAYYGVERTFLVMTIPAFTTQWKGMFAPLSFLLRAGTFFVSVLFLNVEKGAILYSRDIFVLPALLGKGARVCVETHFLQKKEKYLRFFFKYADRIVTTTEHLKERIATFGIDEKRMHVAQDAADLNIFDIDLSKEDARGRVGLPHDMSIVGYTGSLTTVGLDKGIDTALEAVALLVQKREQVLFVAVGGSAKDRDRYQRKARAMGVTEHTQFLPRVSLDRLAIYQKACDVLIMPFPNKEHFAYYMSPLKMFEYMASKRPILSTALPAMREILDDTMAVFFEPDNVPDMAEKIKNILADPDTASELSARAHQKVQNYSWEKRAARILDFIKM